MTSSEELLSAEGSQGKVREAAAQWWLASAVISSLILLCNLQLLTGHTGPQWDGSDCGGAFALVADHIKHGRLVMWDPWIAGGSPDFAEPSLGTTSPLVLFVGLLTHSFLRGFVAYWMILWILSANGMLLLARYLGSPVWGAMVVTLGYTASGFFTGHAEHTSFICSIAYLPWVLWRFDKCLATKSYWPGVQAAILLGLSALGGYPAFTIITPGFLLLWGCGRIWFESPEKVRGLVRLGVTLSVIVVVAGTVCSPAYISFLKDGRGYTDRSGPLPRAMALSVNRLAPQAVSTFASPFIALLDVGPKPLWPETDVSMCSLYMGGGAFLLALLGVKWKWSWRTWLLLMAGFFWCCALGDAFPVRGWIYDLVPPTRYFRNPALFSVYATLLLAVLGCLAARDIDSEQSTRRVFPTAVVAGVGAAAALWLELRAASTIAHGQWFAMVHLAMVWLGLIGCGLLWSRGGQIAKMAPKLLIAIAIGDSAGTLIISNPITQTDAVVPWWRAMDRHHDGNLDLTFKGLNREERDPVEVAGTTPSNRNLALKVAVFDSYVTMANRFHYLFINHPEVRWMALGPDRLWFLQTPARAIPSEANFEVFVKAFAPGEKPPFVLHSPQQMEDVSSEFASVTGVDYDLAKDRAAHARISKLSYRPNSLALHFDAPSDGWLMVTDRWAKGWEAVVNGTPTPVWGADFIFRAVKVYKGPNDVAMRYLPSGFIPLLVLSWGTLLMFSSLEITRLARRRRR